MLTREVLETIAAAAHVCWCARMQDEGWVPGKVYDAEAKVHPALCPFGELPLFDRARLSRDIACEEYQESLAECMDSVLCTREFSARDLCIGRRVRFQNDSSGEVGRVVALNIEDESAGLLSSVSVEWPDGEVHEYLMCDGIEPAEEPVA